MAYFITGLYFILVDLTLRLAIAVPYIFSDFLLSDTEFRKIYIMLVDTMCLKLFTVGIPILLYIFLDNLALHICMFVNTIIFSSTVVTTLYFSVVYVVLKTCRPCLFPLNLTIPLLV